MISQFSFKKIIQQILTSDLPDATMLINEVHQISKDVNIGRTLALELVFLYGKRLSLSRLKYPGALRRGSFECKKDFSNLMP